MLCSVALSLSSSRDDFHHKMVDLNRDVHRSVRWYLLDLISGQCLALLVPNPCKLMGWRIRVIIDWAL
jgi:hypothetical protein